MGCLLQMMQVSYVPQLNLGVLTTDIIFGSLILAEVIEAIEYLAMRYRSDVGKWVRSNG